MTLIIPSVRHKRNVRFRVGSRMVASGVAPESLSRFPKLAWQSSRCSFV